MSHLRELIAQAKSRDPQMGADLEREFQALSSRLPFGLNFEGTARKPSSCRSARCAGATRCGCCPNAAL